ncbi:MAG TPA: hypothetical protein VNW23_05245 [Opitutaceae bacterium]|jgi:hypothetical protein|nr:hypothetical protein [Opitutaceae bacterium]
MSNSLFPSGQWVGFYTYTGRPSRFLMDLLLEFKNGVMSGEGADGIGSFSVSGIYSAENNECSWRKQYVVRHSLIYRGFREKKGVWGTWAISTITGGFHIWPLSDGGPLPVIEEEREAINCI